MHGHVARATEDLDFGLDPAARLGLLEGLCSSLPVPVGVKASSTRGRASAAEHGAAGIVVSNHGGRQLDVAPATIDALLPSSTPPVTA